MAKDAFYFSHDYNAQNDEKILELRSEYGAEGYGVFWMIIETMAQNENGGVKATLMGGLSLGYGVAKGRLSDIINKCISIGLFYMEGDFLFSKRLLKHKYIRKTLSEKGKEGADKRWGGYREGNGGGIANPMPKERKGKEIKGNKSKELIQALPLVYPFNSDLFLNTWKEWVSYRQEIKQPYKSPKSIQADLKRIGALSENNEPVALLIIEQSIAGGWKGLFELKNHTNGTSNKQPGGNYRTRGQENYIAAIMSSPGLSEQDQRD
jgi:hypothetical protein